MSNILESFPFWYKEAFRKVLIEFIIISGIISY